MAEVTELITKFGFEGSTAPLADYNARLGKGIGLLAGFVTATVATGVALQKMASDTLATIQPLIDLNAQTGVAVETIQELGYVASVSSSSAQALESSIVSLSAKIGDAAQKGSEDFARLGIAVRDANGQVKQADQILGEVGQRFRSLGLSMSEQQSFAEALGIDASLLQMLNRTSTETQALREQARALGVLNAEQVQQAQEYNDALTTLNFGLDSTRRLIAVGLAPEMTSLVGNITDLIEGNRDWIVSGIQATVSFIGDLIDALIRLAPFIATVAAGFVAAKVGVLGFTGALAALFSPAVLIAAGIAAVLLVVDDLIVAFQGGKSVIADFFQEFLGVDIVPILHDVVDAATAMLAGLSDIVGEIIVIFGGVGSAIYNALSGNFDKAFEDIRTALMLYLDLITQPFVAFFDWLGEQLSGVTDILGPVANFFGFGSDEQTIPAGAPGMQIRPGANSPPLGGGTSVIEQTNNIEIRTSDPERAGRSAADNLQRQLDDARTQSQRGGM